jgi:hypothetical protein
LFLLALLGTSTGNPQVVLSAPVPVSTCTRNPQVMGNEWVRQVVVVLVAVVVVVVSRLSLCHCCRDCYVVIDAVVVPSLCRRYPC